ncbi:RICIN domain-containing protein [Streptomyces abikoensis]|uniref:RICIN domain-containing protein n=1 Tax=Streptomyces abikoensis TaxID=97398 RepID=UPI001E4E3CDD|nr:RICIN domain-containing protein [Streptomyces abikoensis]
MRSMFKGRTSALAAGAVVITAALTAFAPSAGASASSALDGPFQFQNVATGKCLDTNGSSIYPHECNGGNYQRWYRNVGGGYQLQNVATGKCLDTNGSSLYPHDCNGGNYQRWIFNGYPYQLQNVATGKCLDTNGSSMYPHDCNGGNYQRWII